MALFLRSSKRPLHRFAAATTPDYFHLHPQSHYTKRCFSDTNDSATTSGVESSEPTATIENVEDASTPASKPRRSRYSYLFKGAKVHRRGEDSYGSREYIILPSGLTLEQYQADPLLKLASIYAHRNILFGARSFVPGVSLIEACERIFDVALPEASARGEQPQAVSTLHGLNEWVTQQLQADFPSSAAIQQLRKDLMDHNKRDEAAVAHDAVTALARGVPRKGHGALGASTLRDGQVLWEALAKEFCKIGGSEEVKLYEAHGGEVVGIEYQADKSEDYMKSAGGAMARLYFL